MSLKRVHVFISGRVQGVFFRAYTRNEALRLGLTGWVKNLPNSQVEAIFEGETSQLEQMVAWCYEGPPYALVKEVKTVWEKYTGEFDTFSISGW
jgi:acylphosphatase